MTLKFAKSTRHLTNPISYESCTSPRTIASAKDNDKLPTAQSTQPSFLKTILTLSYKPKIGVIRLHVIFLYFLHIGVLA